MFKKIREFILFEISNEWFDGNYAKKFQIRYESQFEKWYVVWYPP